jgi:transposase
MRVAPPIELSAEQRTTLEAWANGRKTQVRVAERARVVLLGAEGKQNLEVATILSISVQKAARWRWRFLAKGLPGLEKDALRPGRLPSVAADKVAEVIRLTTLEKPAHATHWSTRSMAQHMGSATPASCVSGAPRD